MPSAVKKKHTGLLYFFLNHNFIATFNRCKTYTKPMKDLTKTETRIINFDGTIIVLTGEKSNSKRYTVRIDGVFSGHLEKRESAIVPTVGSNIKSIFIEKICEVFKTGKGTAINWG